MSYKPNIGDILIKILCVPLGLYLLFMGSRPSVHMVEAWLYFLPAFAALMYAIIDFLPTYEE